CAPDAHPSCTAADRIGLSTAAGICALGVRTTTYRRGMPDPFVLRPRSAVSLAPDAPAPMTVDPAFGALAEHIRDERVTDIFVNGTQGLFVDRGAGAERIE